VVGLYSGGGAYSRRFTVDYRMMLEMLYGKCIFSEHCTERQDNST
jgi:hypothetical protein